MAAKKFSKLALSLATAAGLFFASVQGAHANKPPADVKLDPNQVLYFNGSWPTTLDPSLATSGDSFSVIKSLFDTLYRKDNTGKYVPVAAASYDVSPDGLVYTFHLRKEAKWSDGQPVTAKDFVYSWQRLTDPKTAAGYGDYLVLANVKNANEVHEGKLPATDLGVKAVDDYTFQVELESPTPWLIQMTSLAVLAPLRQDVVEKYQDKWQTPENIVTNGPYKITVFKFNDELSMEKQLSYWDIANANPTKITFDFISKPEATYLGYLTGRYILSNIPASFKKIVNEKRKDELINVSRNSVSYISINNEKVPDVRVRKALALVVNRSVLTDKIYNFGKPTSVFATPQLDEAQYITEQDWLSRPQAENNAEAVKLLTEAGYSKEKPVTLDLLVSGKADKSIIALQNLVEQGSKGLIKLNLIPEEPRNAYDKYQKKDYVLYETGWNADYDHVSTFLNVFKCKSTINSAGYCNPEYDKLLEQAAKTQDADQRAKLYAEASKVFNADYPIVPILQASFYLLASPKLGGYRKDNDTRYFRDYYLIADKSIAPE